MSRSYTASPPPPSAYMVYSGKLYCLLTSLPILADRYVFTVALRNIACLLHWKIMADKQADMNGPIWCFLLMLEREEYVNIIESCLWFEQQELRMRNKTALQRPCHSMTISCRDRIRHRPRTSRTGYFVDGQSSVGKIFEENVQNFQNITKCSKLSKKCTKQKNLE
jgi:hypothetical protein